MMLRASPPFDCPRLLAPRSSANPNQHRHRLFFSISLCSHNPSNCNGSSRRSNYWEQPNKIILQAMAGALSLALLVSSSPSVAVEVGSLALQLPSSPAELCQEGEEEEREAESVSVTNEGIVEEAWEVVNESFLDAGNRGWSPEKWLQMKNDFTHRAIQTKSKAHGVIKKMLASLRDPYTRFLSPSEMARYDVTGIGINLREIPDDSGATRLTVLGIILDGPAYSAGVRHGDEVLYVNGVDVKGKSAFEVSSLLQGPRETFVTLKVRHGKCGLVQSFTVQRQLVARTPVFYRLEKMDNGNAMVGYIHLKEFNALARKDFVIAMKLLQDSGVSCFVLDLRDNLGGLVQEIVFELLQHLRGNATKSVLEVVTKSTREMLEEQEAVRGRLFTIQDVMQNNVRAWLQDRSLRVSHNLSVFGGCGLVLSIITGLFGINVDGIPGAAGSPYAFGLFSGILVFIGIVLIGFGMLYLGLKNPITEEKVNIRKLELQQLVSMFQHDAENHAKVREDVSRHKLSPTAADLLNGGSYILMD